MKANELRIGNYVNYGGEICEVDLITLEYISIPNNGYESIPLTEKWLTDFGFYQTEEGIKNFGEGNWGNGKKSIFYFKGDCDMNGTKLKYVHQLQNLYFALTGTELTLK